MKKTKVIILTTDTAEMVKCIGMFIHHKQLNGYELKQCSSSVAAMDVIKNKEKDMILIHYTSSGNHLSPSNDSTRITQIVLKKADSLGINLYKISPFP
jgi:hypothetical protein